MMTDVAIGIYTYLQLVILQHFKSYRIIYDPLFQWHYIYPYMVKFIPHCQEVLDCKILFNKIITLLYHILLFQLFSSNSNNHYYLVV